MIRRARRDGAGDGGAVADRQVDTSVDTASVGEPGPAQGRTAPAVHPAREGLTARMMEWRPDDNRSEATALAVETGVPLIERVGEAAIGGERPRLGPIKVVGQGGAEVDQLDRDVE